MLDTTLSHRDFLSILARAEPGAIKAVAERALPLLGDIEVIHSRTGLVMQPMRDTVKGTDFHLGEVLVAEAHIRAGDGTVGYGMVVGRDLEHAMAMAVLDASLTSGVSTQDLEDFIQSEQARQAKQDDEILRAVEATRVDMETF